jgi:uncharacterized membrane protein
MNSFSIVLSIISIVSLSLYVNTLATEEKNANYKDNLMKKIITISVGFLFLCLAIFLHIKQDPTKGMYVLLLLTSIGIGITFAALLITIVSKI